jgi:hypothetical protein
MTARGHIRNYTTLTDVILVWTTANEDRRVGGFREANRREAKRRRLVQQEKAG